MDQLAATPASFGPLEAVTTDVLIEPVPPLTETASVKGRPALAAVPVTTFVATLQANGSWKYGYTDRMGRIVIAIEFDYAQDFYRGFALVARGPGFLARVQAEARSGQVDWDCVIIDRNGKTLSLD